MPNKPGEQSKSRSEARAYHICADLKMESLVQHLAHQLDPMHQRAEGHTGTGLAAAFDSNS